jgi:hypothetical protein
MVLFLKHFLVSLGHPERILANCPRDAVACIVVFPGYSEIPDRIQNYTRTRNRAV